MNKVLGLLTAAVLIGWPGLALNLSGSWTMDLNLLPSLGLGETTLSLNYIPLQGWKITSTSVFDGLGFASQKFGLLGEFGPLAVEASMEFAPRDVTLKSISYVIPDSWSGLGYDLLIQDGLWETAGPSYVGAKLSTSFMLSGLKVGLDVEHIANHGITVDAKGMLAEYLFYLDFPAYIIQNTTWILQPHPTLKPLVVKAAGAPYSKYFLTYDNIKLVATKVTFSGVDLNGNPVAHTIGGAFEVYYFDAATNTVILTLGADTYLWYYIAEYGAANGWDLNQPITYSIDIADVEATFLFPSYMTYTFTLGLDPWSAEVVFDDVSTGIQFRSALVTLSNLDLCCGIALDVEFSFTKAGFDYVSFTGINVPLCCGVSLDVSATFGVDSKKVEVTPKFAGFAEACFTVWGNAAMSGNAWTGIEIYGFKISCSIAECNYIEFVNAFNVRKVNEELPEEDRFLAACGEFNLIKLGFCGPGCCGGKYDVTLRAYFGTSGGLFDITRLVFGVKFPLMTGFTFNIRGTFAASSCTSTSLGFGWTLEF